MFCYNQTAMKIMISPGIGRKFLNKYALNIIFNSWFLCSVIQSEPLKPYLGVSVVVNYLVTLHVSQYSHCQNQSLFLMSWQEKTFSRKRHQFQVKCTCTCTHIGGRISNCSGFVRKWHHGQRPFRRNLLQGIHVLTTKLGPQ